MTRAIDRPEPGFFKMRQTRGGPWVPAIIYRTCHCTVNGGDDNWSHKWRESCDRHPYPSSDLEAEIDGKSVEVTRVWPWGRPIDQAEYEYLCGDRDWCRRHAPERLEAATPRDYFRVDLLPPIF
ncbi:hypothetical protein LCGC14_2960120 [marine sediment metagenome]|uniref:Uncharacterized protein n=1 Tax=marine sediment metagenome TaxID=412755 RepID=A0A0F8XZV6_9ZZZZ